MVYQNGEYSAQVPPSLYTGEDHKADDTTGMMVEADSGVVGGVDAADGVDGVDGEMPAWYYYR